MTLSDEIIKAVKDEVGSIDGVHRVDANSVPFVVSVQTHAVHDEKILAKIYAAEKLLRAKYPDVSFDFSCIYVSGAKM